MGGGSCGAGAQPSGVAVPLKKLKLPVIPFWFVKPSTSSPVTKLAVMLTAALARVGLSASVTVRPASTTVALLPSVNASALPVIATTGGLFTAATVIARVAVFELAVPSFATTDTVRAAVDGFLLAFA